MYTTITALEAASMIKNGDSLGLSGFTPAGAPKATTKELAKLAVAEHEKGNEFKTLKQVLVGSQDCRTDTFSTFVLVRKSNPEKYTNWRKKDEDIKFCILWYCYWVIFVFMVLCFGIYGSV